jgi:hypothetical protein
MIKRLLVLFAVLVATLVLAAPASAAGATSQTFNLHGTFPAMPVTPLCGAPGGILYGSGNAVMHTTVNKAGDVWFTATQEEWFTLVPDSGTVTYTGHYAIWFGQSLNKNNMVMHDIFNIRATSSLGTTISIHLVDHINVSASGQVNSFSIGCG